MQDMPQAVFSIKNYYFDKVNIDLTEKPDNNLSLSFFPSGVYNNETKEFELAFVVKVSCRGHEPFITVSCKGIFKFDNVVGFDAIPDFFYNNSIAILFPYLRGYVSMITTQANIPGIILPTLNLTTLGGELKKNSRSN